MFEWLSTGGVKWQWQEVRNALGDSRFNGDPRWQIPLKRMKLDTYIPETRQPPRLEGILCVVIGTDTRRRGSAVMISRTTARGD